MRALCTGGRGFIGSHLTQRLLADGWQVTIIDNGSTGHWTPPAGAEVVDADIAAVWALQRHFDAIWHLAAAVGVRNILDHPARSMVTNLQGTHAVLDFALRENIPVLLASSSEVYGLNTKLPFREDDNLTLGPSSVGRWSYAAAKLADECLGLSYYKEYGLPVTVVRLFNCTGPRQSDRYGMVLPRLVSQALRGEPLTVYGTGQQSRCFCHVSDTVEALFTLGQIPQSAGQVFNVGSTDPITIWGLAEEVRYQVAQRTGKPASDIVRVSYADAYGSPDYADMPARVPDISKIRRLIGWEPKVNLREIVTSVISYQCSIGCRAS